MDDRNTLARIYLGCDHNSKMRQEQWKNSKKNLLSRQLRCFSLTCLPMIPKQYSLMRSLWARGLFSLALYSANYSAYSQMSAHDIEHTRRFIERIAQGCSCLWPKELKAFLIHSLLTHVIAYRDGSECKNSSHPFYLPTWHQGQMQIKPCRYEQDVNLWGGFTGKIFVPQDGIGSASYVLHGTTSWGCHSGTGFAITDDFNPLGPGYHIRKKGLSRLQPLLEEHYKRLGEKAVLVGHSLGGILTTAFAVDLPGLVCAAFAFSPTRPTYGICRKWERLQRFTEELQAFTHKFGLKASATLLKSLAAEKNSGKGWPLFLHELGAEGTDQLLLAAKKLFYLKERFGNGPVACNAPALYTFVSSFAGYPDFITCLGDNWIGRVFQVSSAQKAHPLFRHVAPIATRLNFSIKELDIEKSARSWPSYGFWAVLQRLAALFLYSGLLPLLLLKRFLVGWNSANLWRYGVFGLPFQLLRPIFARKRAKETVTS